MFSPQKRTRLTDICPQQTGDMSLLQKVRQPELDLCHVQAEQIYWTHEGQGGKLKVEVLKSSAFEHILYVITIITKYLYSST